VTRRDKLHTARKSDRSQPVVKKQLSETLVSTGLQVRLVPVDAQRVSEIVSRGLV
jgi:hypothetical protein